MHMEQLLVTSAAFLLFSFSVSANVFLLLVQHLITLLFHQSQHVTLFIVQIFKKK